ncbi:MAG: C25 family cysteine peptidase [Candidatus Edwardsbacteria bacterium]|nr:C25 family cysteine peptidase [Candidatus Edwardsbacteria bacterium]
MNTTIAMIMAAALLCGASGQALQLPGTAGDRSAVTLVSRSDGAVTVACQLGRLEGSVLPAAAMEGAAEDFLRLSLPEGGLTGEMGKPALPTLCAVLDVPHGAAIELSVDPGPALSVNLAGIGPGLRIAPALGPVPKVEGARPRFVIDRGTYGAAAFYPAAPAEIDDIAARAGLARGHRLAAVRFHPVQYDPVAGVLRYFPRMTATVTFRGGDRTATAAAIARDYSPDWESFIGRLAVNRGQWGDGSTPSLPSCYDVFYGGTYAAAAARLADWKRSRGFQVRCWDASGWTAAAINDSILAQSPRATYLLLVSDPDGTDPLPVSADGPATGAPTDLYYAETDENGYLPDLFGARLSVKSAAEADAAVDKAIRYEQAEFGAAGVAWLKRALLIAGYDAYYQPVGVATNAYCQAVLARCGYDVDTLIMAPGEGKTRIVPFVNAGTAWTVYSAHGSVTGWQLGGTYWNADQLAGDLSNQDRYTLPMGHCCLSGDFNSTGKEPGNTDCFGETWTRLAGKGGVSYFGSVPSTYWDEDDWLQRRYFDAIYDSIPGSPGLRLAEAGRFTQHGLFWIEANTATSLKQYYFEAYHLLNDPALKVWVRLPYKSVQVTPTAVAINVPTAISLTLTDPDSGNAPVAGVGVYLVDGGDSVLLAATDSTGRAGFTVTARSAVALRLRGWQAGGTAPAFEAAIAVRSPAASALERAAPNPFRGATRIGFAMAADGDAAIAIYDVLGRRVRTLLSGRRPVGYHSVVWDGRNADGTAVAAGIYFCRLTTPRSDGCQRLVLFR